MTPLIRKEIRLLLPFFGIALFLAVLPAWFVSANGFASSGNQSIFWVFGFGLVLLGLAPFGQEVGLGTFSSSLAQPAQRNRIWTTKFLVMLAAALLVLLALIVSIHLRFDSLLKEVAQRIDEEKRANYLWDLDFQKSLLKALNSHSFWWIGLAAAAVGLSGGLWSSLLFRQIGAALWFSLLVPAVFFIGVEWFVPGEFAREIILLVGAAVYSLAGVLWAHRLFLQAQDVQWLGDTISPFALRSASAQTASAELRRLPPSQVGRYSRHFPTFIKGVKVWRHSRALVRKEILSHQITYLVAFGLFVLHICTLAIRKFYTFPHNSEMRFAVESVPFLWFLLPWLIGSVAVAEERKLGTVESQFCIPVRRFFQFIVKFAIVLLLGIVLGALVPCLLEAGGISLGISSGFSESNFVLGPEFFSFAGITAIIAAILAAISFYASTLTRNTLHALGAGILFTGAFWVLFEWVISETHTGYGYSFWSGDLIFRIGIPVLVIAVLCLSWSNYKLLYVGGNVWLRNVLILGVSLFLVGTGTAVIYQRPWELLTSLEPKHGPARLSGPVRPALCTSDNRAVALLPDGRLWAGVNYRWKDMDQYYEYEAWDAYHQVYSKQMHELQVAVPGGGQFVGGSNWVSVAAIPDGEVVALQSDGSLWRILSWRDNAKYFEWKPWFSLIPEPRRIGSDSDWKSVVGTGTERFLALKTDGSVWQLGYLDDGPGPPSMNYHTQQPVRLGTNSDWAAIFAGEGQVLFMKYNGEIWTQERDARGRYELKKTNMNGSDWLAVAGWEPNFYLHKDGSLWASGSLPRIVFGTRNRSITMHRIGRDSDWQQIATGHEVPVGLKNGKIVESNRELFSATLGQPSRSSDWLAVDADDDRLLALAADGTISCWYPREATGRLLGPTRRPVWSMNVLDDTK